MKKLLALMLFVLMTLNVSAQHMKFMGIPLNGTIAQFTTKLQAKGVTISPTNKYSGAGCRYFSGSFFGQKADIYVYYIPSSKLVYRAKAVIESDNFEWLKNVYKEVSESLNNKYPGQYSEGSNNGYESTSYQIDLGVRTDIFEGLIDLYFTDNGLSYSKVYYLHVDYYDSVNNDKYQATIEDDL